MNRMKELSFPLFHARLKRIAWVPMVLMAAIFLGTVSFLLYRQHRSQIAQIEAELADAVNSQEQYFAQELYLSQEQAIRVRMDAILKAWSTRHEGIQACIQFASDLLSGPKRMEQCAQTGSTIAWETAGIRENRIEVGGKVVARIQYLVIRPASWLDLFPPSLLVALLVAVISATLLHHGLVDRLRKKILDPLLQAAAREQRNAAIAETTQMIAHDLRKPFAMTKMMLMELSEIRDPEAFRALRDQIAPEIQRSLNSVDSMLKDIMEIGTEAELVRSVISPTALIRTALYDVLRIYGGSNIKIRYDLRHQNMVEVDEEKVARVFSNLLENAVQALSMRGTVMISTRQVSENRDTHIEFCIANNGPVIAAEDLEKVFEAFFTRKKGGSGLGLAIAKKIVQVHGGRIWCESSEAGGTRFYFTLPASFEAVDDCDLKRFPKHSTEVFGPTMPSSSEAQGAS